MSMEAERAGRVNIPGGTQGHGMCIVSPLVERTVEVETPLAVAGLGDSAHGGHAGGTDGGSAAGNRATPRLTTAAMPPLSTSDPADGTAAGAIAPAFPPTICQQ